jgi:hypothetical protein
LSTTTAKKLAYRLAYLLNDTDHSDESFSLPRKMAALDRAMLETDGTLPAEMALSATFLTLSANVDSYVVAGITDVNTVDTFRRLSDGIPVERRSLSEIQSMRLGPAATMGQVQLIGFREDGAGVLTAEVWPRPTASDTIEAVYSINQAITFEGAAATDLDATIIIAMGAWATEALLYKAAELLTATAAPEVLAKLKLSAGAPKYFADRYRVMLANESQRIAGLQANGFMQPVL